MAKIAGQRLGHVNLMSRILTQKNNTPERTQNCNLELSHAHIHDEESCDSPGGQFPARRCDELLNLWLVAHDGIAIRLRCRDDEVPVEVLSLRLIVGELPGSSCSV